jgi:hypothetical protein
VEQRPPARISPVGGGQCHIIFSISKTVMDSWTRPGRTAKNDGATIEKARVNAIGVSLDKPEVDPERHIAVINDAGQEISKVAVYSKPSAQHPAE